jgi:hypothetical protein
MIYFLQGLAEGVITLTVAIIPTYIAYRVSCAFERRQRQIRKARERERELREAAEKDMQRLYSQALRAERLSRQHITYKIDGKILGGMQ